MGKVNSKFRIAAVLLFGLLAALAGGGTGAVAQSASSSGSHADVQFLFPEQVTVEAGKPSPVALHFRIAPGLHINSNTPRSEFLIATALKMDVPTDIMLGKIEYPAGEDLTFPFSPDEKLSVYAGDFTVAVGVHPLHSVVPGKYVMHGVLRYQACDNAACYPPRTLPVSFEVKVTKEPPEHHANPAQSPHAHN